MLSRCSASLVCLLAATAVLATSEEGEEASPPPSLRNLLLCLRREYTLKATRSDPQGRRCWDLITATSCWGRCDSFEIPDWRFPFKISYHPVCVHDQRVLRRVQLRNCDPGADPELRVYEFYEAVSCACKVCNSSDTFCDWRNHLANHHSHHQHHNNHHHHKNSHHHHRDD